MAVSLSSFIDYQATSAWTWEKLALTRARVVAGDAALVTKLNAAIATSLCAKRDTDQTRKDVSDMRALMLREQKNLSLWDIKKVEGGLVDVEFIAQYLQLVHANTEPRILQTNTHASLLQAARLKFLDADDAEQLLEAIAVYQRLTQLLRLCLTETYDPSRATKNMNQAVCRAAKMPDINATEAHLSETQKAVSMIFEKIIGRS